MFDVLREKTKVILWITVGAFILLMFIAWGADFQVGRSGGAQANHAGQVNGSPVSYPYYSTVVANQRSNYVAQAGREPDDRTEVVLRNNAWNGIIQEMLLNAEAKKRGISVTDDEVLNAVLNMPDPSMQANPAFQTNGQFDLAKYQALLRNPNMDPNVLLQLEDQARRQLPLQKLQQQVMGTVVVSDAELWDNFRMQNEQARVQFVLVPADKIQIDESAASQPVLEAYFRKHESEYKTPPQAVVQYVTIPRHYTADDSLALWQEAKQVTEDAKGGEDFLTLVEAYSEAPLNQRGGENSTPINPDNLPGSVRDAALNLPVGQVSDVLVEPLGFHVLRIEERTGDATAGFFVKIADVFYPLVASAQTLDTARQAASDFRREVERRPFAEAAADARLPVRESKPFGEKGFIPSMGTFPEIQQFAFGHQVGAISAPVERPEGWMIARLSRRTDARVPDMNEVLDRVKASVMDSLRVEQAAAQAASLLPRAQAGEPLESIAKSDPTLQYDRPDPFTRTTFVRGLGNDASILGAIFSAPGNGLVPRVLKGKRGAAILAVEEKIPADRQRFEDTKQTLRDAAVQRSHNQVVTAWLDDLKRHAKVDDYRAGFFN